MVTALIFLLFTHVSKAQTDDLMIVEYLDCQSGNGGAIKIFNPTPDTIDLSPYQIISINNGGACPATTNLSGQMLPGASLRAYFGSYTTPPNSCTPGDLVFNTCGFNGDDHIGLQKNGVYVDMVNNPTVQNAPTVNGSVNGLLRTHIVRQNTNCTRYTETNGTTTNSWPTNPFTNVPGWDVFSASGRCIDSATTYTFQGFKIEDTLRICQGDSALIGGIYRSVPGVYMDTIASQLACDSILEVTLEVSSFYSAQRNASICDGDSVFLENGWQTAQGVYFDTLAYPGTCDTVLETSLQLLPSGDTSRISPVICSGGTYSFHGQMLDTTGVYYAQLQNSFGCDSIVEATLTVHPGGDTTHIHPTICADSTYSFFGQSLNTSGVYYATAQNIFGCDSIIEANLTVNRGGDTTIINPVICSDGAYSFFGQVLSVQGTYFHQLQNVFGCDSVIQANLSVNRGGDTTTIHPAICSDSTFSFHGQSLSMAGTYYSALQNAFGCDSVVEAVLTVFPDGDTTTIHPVICKDSAFLFHGQVLSVQGTYYATLQTIHGCDSVVEAMLSVNRGGDTTTLTPAICQGSSYSFNNRQINLAGTYYDTLQNVFGCDSIIEAVLTVIPADTLTITPEICDGDTFDFGGQMLVSPGTYYRTKQSPGACDTVVEAILTLATPPSKSYTLSACPGDTVRIGALSIVSDTAFSLTKAHPFGVCDSLISYSVSFSNMEADFTYFQSAEDSSNVQFFNETQNFTDQQWYFGDGDSSSEVSPEHQYSGPGVYDVRLVVQNAAGCKDSITYQVFVPSPENFEVPNVFSPNGDGVNEYFQLMPSAFIPGFRIEIYNRWGGVVFQSSNSRFQWDGRHQGSICAAGVYYWVISREGEGVRKGFVTLVR